MNTTENNKLIAEFMGYETVGDGYIIPYDDTDNDYYLPEHLKFHSSWEWLMPVVEKIENTSVDNKDNSDSFFNVVIEAFECDINGGGNTIHANGHTKKEATYKAVVEFIKWYNENNKTREYNKGGKAGKTNRYITQNYTDPKMNGKVFYHSDDLIDFIRKNILDPEDAKLSDDFVFDEAWQMDEFRQEKKIAGKWVNVETMMKKGGKAGSEWDEWNYLKLRKEGNCLYLKLTPEGKEELEDLIEKGNHGELAISYLFEDVQGNSSMRYFDKSPVGLTEAPVITEGYEFGNDDVLVPYRSGDGGIYWFPNYMIKDFTADLLKGETVCFVKAESYEEGGELNSLSQIDVYNTGGKLDASVKQSIDSLDWLQTMKRIKQLKKEMEQGLLKGDRYEDELAYLRAHYRKDRISHQQRMFEADLNNPKRKTVDMWFVQGNYGSGWEDLTAHTTRFEAEDELKVYDANESYPHRKISRRIKKEDYHKGNYEEGGELNSLSQIDVYRGGGTISTQIEEMLKENTGVHFMDSGGDDGRAWQRNQGTNFEKEPRVSYEIWNGDLDETVSTYHYLTEVLDVDDFSEEVNEYLNEMSEQGEDTHWAQECWELVKERFDVVAVGDLFNTYNYEYNLSQILQGQIFWNNDNDTPYVLLQIHGGADVRGGYTSARCFELKGYLTGQVDVIGSVDGRDVENSYNGYSLTYADDNSDIEDLPDDADVSLDFYVMDETYIYNPNQYKKGGEIIVHPHYAHREEVDDLSNWLIENNFDFKRGKSSNNEIDSYIIYTSELSEDDYNTLTNYLIENSWDTKYKKGGKAGRSYPTGRAWHMDRLWTSEQPHEVAYRPKRKSKVRSHKRDKARDSKEVWEVARRGIFGVGGFIAGTLIGGYVGYKVGRSKPQKTGFETEKKIAKKISSKAKRMATEVKKNRAKRLANS